LSPDASYLSTAKWENLSDDDKNKFAPVCPEFVVDVRSKSDNVEDLMRKMNVWIENKSELAWLIDPIEKITYVFRLDGSTETIRGFDRMINGDGPVQGFELDLTLLK
jgi:Uma2 family endonuclease